MIVKWGNKKEKYIRTFYINFSKIPYNARNINVSKSIFIRTEKEIVEIQHYYIKPTDTIQNVKK